MRIGSQFLIRCCLPWFQMLKSNGPAVSTRATEVNADWLEMEIRKFDWLKQLNQAKFFMHERVIHHQWYGASTRVCNNGGSWTTAGMGEDKPFVGYGTLTIGLTPFRLHRHKKRKLWVTRLTCNAQTIPVLWLTTEFISGCCDSFVIVIWTSLLLQ